MANKDPSKDTRFKKGKSGNPGGRPSLKAWSEAISAALAEVDAKSKKTKLAMVATALVDAAIGGDVSAMREIGDRIEGRAIQAVQVAGNLGLSFIVNK